MIVIKCMLFICDLSKNYICPMIDYDSSTTWYLTVEIKILMHIK